MATAATDEGILSAAGRCLKRTQSVVCETLANLEGQLGGKSSLFAHRAITHPAFAAFPPDCATIDHLSQSTIANIERNWLLS
jgi:hypothetical protein